MNKYNIEIQPALLSRKNVAKYLDMCERSIFTLTQTDPDFPKRIKLGSRCVRYSRKSLDEWLSAKEPHADSKEK